MDNFPVETMVKLCEPHSVIGVVINPFKERKREYDYDTSLSGWKILWSRLNQQQTAAHTVDAAYVDAGVGDQWHSHEPTAGSAGRSDDYTQCKGFSFTDYEKWRELAQVGYDAALEPLREWRAGQADL